MRTFLFHLLAVFGLLFVLTSCTSSSTVNILIHNEGDNTLTNKTVEVPVGEIRQWLGVTPADSLYLLNEKNEPVKYVYNADRSVIRFTLPVAQKRSQKNYSVNAGDPALLDNLFAFRQQKIRVTIS
ncbi:MAG: hypothetical protein IKH64_09815 [Prevotella sp.]|nr:hypothetical protein [Prevotella sp.]